jgi:phage tail sheath protein FI
MPSYLSPGVYVHEVPSGNNVIMGVGTSTAAFIGLFPDTIQCPGENPEYDPSKKATAEAAVSESEEEESEANAEGKPAAAAKKKTAKSSSTDNCPYILEKFKPVGPGEIKLITNMSEFRRLFGGYSTDQGHRYLAHAVNGFFMNGGTRCFVVREKSESKILTSALEKCKSIDEISMVAVPGISDNTVRGWVVSHCEEMGDRFAILDCEEITESDDIFDRSNLKEPQNSDYAAYYIPWLNVFDPATKIQDPESSGKQYIPPSGHIAGIYARVDSERGVHKAPANEVVRGVGSADDLKYRLSKSQQDGLNPIGCNCIRHLNGNVRVWGARTAGGDANGEWKYVNVRRLFLYLRESIDKGTQWVVFEPNTEDLWQKITLNVSAYLTNVWRDGALFGSTAEEAFYVKCDAETNPPEVRDIGQVVTEIGVAVAKPAEFVVFKISQWPGPGK